MTYRSRGRSIVEVVLVSCLNSELFLWEWLVSPSSLGTHSVDDSITVFRITHSSLLSFSFVPVWTHFHNNDDRRFASQPFWWVSLPFYASVITFEQNGLKTDSVNDDWQNWQRVTMAMPVIQMRLGLKAAHMRLRKHRVCKCSNTHRRTRAMARHANAAETICSVLHSWG